MRKAPAGGEGRAKFQGMNSQDAKKNPVDWNEVGARLAWVIGACALVHCVAASMAGLLPLKLPVAVTYDAVGIFATVAAAALFLARMLVSIAEWGNRHLLWALDGFEGAFVTLAVVVLFLSA